ncbi:MAG: hypothetical protein LBP78_07265 [Acidaminococcales bacterium]|jgi:predicted nucleic acid-binding protein|nr:hypothetical protein [Acidaminococcales bacterium]
MKKILALLLFILAFGAGVPKANAEITLLPAEGLPKIALYVFLDPKGISDPTASAEKIHQELKTEVEKGKKASVLPFELTNKILRRYIRENTSAETAREADSGFIVKKNDLIALAKEAQADYILFLNARVSSDQVKWNVWTGIRSKRTILFEMVLTDKEAKDYLLDEVFSEAGSAQGTAYDRAFNKALVKILEKIDFSKIDF